MAKQDTKKLEILNAKEALLQRQISLFRQDNKEVPKQLTDALNKIQTQINPNKYNAKKVTHNGMNFDSAFEMWYCQLLEKTNINFEHHRVLVLQEKFSLTYEESMRDYSENIQAITYEPDFVIDDLIIIDIKGNQATETQVFINKFKMLKNRYRDRYYYIIVSNKSEAILSIALIQRILASKKK